MASAATTALPTRPAAPADAFDMRKLIAFVAMVFGMFMALLDIQIVSASLADIQAGLSASSDEITWVQTAYLIAEVVMIPLSGYLARGLSTRVLFTISAFGFTVMSLMCGMASSIGEMIVYRAAQGFIGGAMIPTVFSSAYTLFPRSKQHLISPIVGLIATMAPTVGPTIGGYLTDLYSWHWLFFVNIIPGILVSLSVWTLVDFDKPDHNLLRRFDWSSLIFLALFLCSLEYVLEEGPTKDWFDDDTITTFLGVSIVGGIAFIWRNLTIKNPIVDLSAYTNRNFAAGTILAFALGICLFGMTYLYPVFLGRVRGYSSLQIGETMFVSGLSMLATAPFAGRLAQKLDPRAMIALGFVGLAISCWLVGDITKDWDFGELLLPQILRGVSLMISFVPINNLALGTLRPEQLKGGSGLYNLSRNLGGAFGLAGINTLMNNRLDLHLQRLHDSVNGANAKAVAMLQSLTEAYATMPDPAGSALKQLAAIVRGQAVVMAFADVFIALTAICLVCLPLVTLLRRPRVAPAGGGGH